nr:uncharacterized protein LOC109179738 isoform X2 [Ipomoea trifida]
MYSCAGEQPEPEVEARGQQDDDDGDAWEYELTPEEAARFGSLTTRCSARVLVKARKKFSRRQQGAVRALGFGKLLDLEVVQTPGRMGRWLLENFDPKTMSLRLGNGVSLPIQEKDVEATLGLPRGRVTITKHGNNDVSNFLLRWRGKFGTTSHEITPKMIALEMASLTDGCEWFKRHFTTLMVTTLIECMNNGYAYQMITDEFEEVEKIGELNWCKFLLDSLVETRAAWLKNPRQRYIGPILFLTVFYVDRVSFGARSVARSVPAISGWTRKLLCGREFAEIRGGGFGLGTVEPRLCDVVVDGALGGGNGGAGDGGEDAHSDGPNDADLSKPCLLACAF